MSRLIVRRFSQPDDVIRVEGVEEAAIDLGDVKIARTTHRPGWRWSTHVKHLVGTQMCQVRHVGFCFSGRMGVRLDDGEERVIEPGEAFSIPPGHDGWVVGDEPLVTVDWTGVAEWLAPVDSKRVLASLLMTDIVDSTGQLRRSGDRRWRAVLAEHDDRLRAVARNSGGHEIKSTGDGFLFAYDGAARAVRAAARMRDAAADLGLSIRAAVHAGEVEIVPNDVRGIAVHEVARILSASAPGEVLVSDVTRLLAAGGGLTFADRGRHRLKGFEDEVSLFALSEVG